MKKLYVFIFMAMLLVLKKDFNVHAEAGELNTIDVYATDIEEATEVTTDIFIEEDDYEDYSIEDEESIVEIEDSEDEEDAEVIKASKVKVTKKETNTAKKVAATTKKTYTDEDLKLLACLIHAEAGGQPYEGKLAVANVVLNRVASNLYPNTIKTVIYDKKWAVQFSVTVNGALSKQLANYKNFTTSAHKSSIKAAKEALEGTNNIGSYLRFTRYSKTLANKVKNYRKIADHIFY